MDSFFEKRRYKLLYLLLYFPCFIIQRDLNNDIWWILNNGRYVLQNGIPNIEPFTIHQGMSYLMQQWLSAVIFWETYSMFGELGLILFVSFVYIILTYLTFKLCMLLSDNNFFVSFIISFIAVECISIFMTQRPYIFLFVIIVLELLFLERYIKFNKGLYLLPLIVLSILLINLEAAMWPILFVILIPYIIDSFSFKFVFIEGQGYGKKKLFLAILGMVAAGFLNPYGIKAITYLFTSYGFDEISNFITEMQCLNINGVEGKFIVAVIVLVFFSFYIYKNSKNRLRFYLLAVGTAYMAFSSIRSYSLFIICGIIPLTYYFRDFYLKDKLIMNNKKNLLIRRILTFSTVALVVFTIAYKDYSNINKGIEAQQKNLIESADLLEKQSDKTKDKIYAAYDEGGYMEFRGFKVYIDARADVFLKTNNKKYDVMKEFYDLQKGKIYYKEILDKYDFKYLLVAKKDILYNYLDHDRDYKLINSSSNYKIYEKVNN